MPGSIRTQPRIARLVLCAAACVLISASAAAAVDLDSNWVDHDKMNVAMSVALKKNLPMIVYCGAAPKTGTPHYRDKTFAGFVGVHIPGSHRPIILKKAMLAAATRIGASHHYWVYLLDQRGNVIATMPKSTGPADRGAIARLAVEVTRWRTKSEAELREAEQLVGKNRLREALKIVAEIVEADARYTALAYKSHRVTLKADPPGDKPVEPVKPAVAPPDNDKPLPESKHAYFADEVAVLRKRIDAQAQGLLAQARTRIEQNDLDGAKAPLATLVRDNAALPAVDTARAWLATLEKGKAPHLPAEAKPDTPAPGDAEAAPFVASKNSTKVHRGTCTWAKRIGENNRVIYKAYQAAVDAGLTPCKTCDPQEPAADK